MDDRVASTEGDAASDSHFLPGEHRFPRRQGAGRSIEEKVKQSGASRVWGEAGPVSRARWVVRCTDGMEMRILATVAT